MRIITPKLLFIVPLLLVVVIVLFRAIVIFEPLPAPQACKDIPGHDRIKLTKDAIDRFIGALNIPTISYARGHYEPSQLLRLIDYLESSYPEIHRSELVTREKVSNYSLIYTVHGSNKTLRPYLLTAHLDVVPAVIENWSSDPFKAVIKEDNYIYARGTIDCKHLLISMLEAFEFMLKNQFKPQRSFYLVFGHDEEINGLEGAKNIARILKERLKLSTHYDQLEYVLDEGNIISKTRFPGLDNDIALVGVVEKGYVTVKVSTSGAVGHGSMPPLQTAIAKLCTAVGKFHANLFPSFLGQGVEREMIEIFARYAAWPYKLAYSNFWLFKPVFSYIFSNDPSMNALIRTSTAVNMISGGTKENVLPYSAHAIINHRVHPLQKAAQVLDFDRQIVNDPSISVDVLRSDEPSPIAPYSPESYGYQLIKQTILQIYPKTVVVPSTFLAASDSRWYANLTESIYKFSAIAVHLDEMTRFHGDNERISLENFENLINFFHHLIQNSDKPSLKFTTTARDET